MMAARPVGERGKQGQKALGFLEKGVPVERPRPARGVETEALPLPLEVEAEASFSYGSEML
jgi:hypothetical protein